LNNEVKNKYLFARAENSLASVKLKEEMQVYCDENHDPSLGFGSGRRNYVCHQSFYPLADS
jgi:hypothetical protein